MERNSKRTWRLLWVLTPPSPAPDQCSTVLEVYSEKWGQCACFKGTIQQMFYAHMDWCKWVPPSSIHLLLAPLTLRLRRFYAVSRCSLGVLNVPSSSRRRWSADRTAVWPTPLHRAMLSSTVQFVGPHCCCCCRLPSRKSKLWSSTTVWSRCSDFTWWVLAHPFLMSLSLPVSISDTPTVFPVCLSLSLPISSLSSLFLWPSLTSCDWCTGLVGWKEDWIIHRGGRTSDWS